METHFGRTRSTATPATPGLARLAAIGMLGIALAAGDATAGSGMVTTDFAGETDRAFAGVLWAKTNVVAAGMAISNSESDFGLARYSTIDGTLDPTFGVGGKVTTDVSPDNDVAYAVTVRDDRIIAAGNAGVDAALVRYMPNGDLDPSFAGTGIVKTDFLGGGDQFEALGLVNWFQTTRIVAAGTAGNAPGGHDFAIALYDGNGQLVPGFGNGGKATVGFTAGSLVPVPSNDWAQALAVQADKKVVVGGYAYTGGGGCSGTGTNFALARLNTNGTLDSTFGTGGRVITHVGMGDNVTGVQVQSDGKIVVAGSSQAACAGEGRITLVRYHPNGSIDASFGAGGFAIVNFDPTLHEHATGLRIQPDGRLVVSGITMPLAGSAGCNALVARFMPNGVPDPSFGVGGFTMVHHGAPSDQSKAEAVVLTPDRGMVTVGWRSNPQDFLLTRLTPFGDLDLSFGQ